MYVEQLERPIQTKSLADPLDRATIIAWLEQQPAARAYCYELHGDCIWAQYFAQVGCERPYIMRDRLYSGYDVVMALPVYLDDIAKARPRTFGAALERMRAV